MHQQKRIHYRVPLKEIKDTPEKGFYITEDELKKYGLFAGIAFFILTIFAILGQKD